MSMSGLKMSGSEWKCWEWVGVDCSGWEQMGVGGNRWGAWKWIEVDGSRWVCVGVGRSE